MDERGGDSTLLETLKWEQQLLYPLIKHYEDKEQTLMKESFTLIVLYASGVVTVFGIQKPDSVSALIQQFPTNLMLLALSIGFCVLSLILIKYIAATRGGCLITLRQVNCLRQGIDALMYKAVTGALPTTADLLRANAQDSSVYQKAYGQHRKLPIDNQHLRENYKVIRQALRTPDGFMVIALALINVIVFSIPIWIAIMTPTREDKLIGFLSGVALIIYILVIVWVLLSTKHRIESALNVSTTNQPAPEVRVIKNYA